MQSIRVRKKTDSEKSSEAHNFQTNTASKRWRRRERDWVMHTHTFSDELFQQNNAHKVSLSICTIWVYCIIAKVLNMRCPRTGSYKQMQQIFQKQFTFGSNANWLCWNGERKIFWRSLYSSVDCFVFFRIKHDPDISFNFINWFNKTSLFYSCIYRDVFLESAFFWCSFVDMFGGGGYMHIFRSVEEFINNCSICKMCCTEMWKVTLVLILLSLRFTHQFTSLWAWMSWEDGKK